MLQLLKIVLSSENFTNSLTILNINNCSPTFVHLFSALSYCIHSILYSKNSRNGINTTTSTAVTPTNVNQELCPPNQCDGSAIDIAKSGLDK